jgi:hypothetical protein
MLRRLGIAGSSALALLVFVACGRSNASPAESDGDGEDATSGAHSSGSGSGSGGGGVSRADAGFDPSVYQHHRNGTRDGLYIDSVFTQTAAKTTHVLTGFVGMVSTIVYAQPLYVEKGPGGVEAFLVATENNHVTTYNATNGDVIWDTGPSVIGPCATANPPGGQVDSSSIGITGTPYIDIGSRTVFFDAMTTPDNNATFHHRVFALSLDTGELLPHWPVDLNTAVPSDAGAIFDSGVQNQRGALQFLSGVLYVPYGGYNGDGGNYYGSVVGFPVANPQAPTWWHTTALKGGVWGPGALPTDGTSVFPITGNTTGTQGTWGGGEAVIRLTAGPTFSGKAADYYAPSNWEDLDNGDTDLGGASEVILDMPGAPYPHLIVAGGKDGNLYVLNRDNLSGIGGELLKTPVSGTSIKGAPAAYATSLGTYVAFHIEGGSGNNCPQDQGGNLVVLKLTQSPMAATTVWCSTQGALGSPMVTTTDGTSNPIVWNADSKLYGWNGDTGAVIVDGTNTAMSTAIQNWNTPIDANGRMAVAVNGQLYVFTP